VVSGRVQGVFFRDGTQTEARRHGVAGWVTNRRDGDVEAGFEGERDDVEALVAWTRHGPPRARVDGHTVVEEAPQGEQGFRVV
jgi:acylphosphatase